MKSAKVLWFSGLFLIIVLIPLIGRLNTPGQSKRANDNGPPQRMDSSPLPIIAFTRQEPSDPNSTTIEEARARKYNTKYMATISEETSQIFSIVDWNVKLPALPVAQSKAVIL